MASQKHGRTVVVELVRLGIVLTMTAVGYGLGDLADELLPLETEETARLLASVVGALVGYVMGGFLGRAVVRGVDGAASRLEQVPAVQLVATGIGAALGALAGLAMLVPVLLLPFQHVTVPLTLLVLVVLTYTGGQLGASRGAELARYVGVRGRLEVRTPSRGAGVRVLDSSALLDGRIAEIARVGFLAGTVIVPRFVIEEVQRIAAAGPEHRRKLGARGLATLQVIQDEGLVAVEVDDEEMDGVAEVDAKLAALCRARQADLVTADAELARLAEASGIRVLNPHALADAVRSPVLPGDRLALTIVRPGKEPGQGIGYLLDGTMVVVEGGATAVGNELTIDVASIVQSRTGRMLFGSPTLVEEPT